MEVAGLAIGIAGLSGLFSACIDCFDYIQLATTFGDDLGICLLRLDTARLRLSRWGVCFGLAINDSGTQDSACVPLTIQDDGYRVVHQLLEHIRNAFATAEILSARYENQATVHKQQPRRLDDQLAVVEPAAFLENKTRRVHMSLTELAKGRQKQTSLYRRTRWAIHDKKRFETLINTIHDSVQSLIDLFPAPVAEQMKKLSRIDASRLSSAEDVELLAKVCSTDDIMLYEALKEESALRGHLVSDWIVSGKAVVRVGDKNVIDSRPTSHTATKFVVSDSADIWIGNEFRSNR